MFMLSKMQRLCTTFLLLLLFGRQKISANIIELTPQEFHDMHLGTPDGKSQFDLVIDVRTLSEFNQGHVENATLVNSFGYLLSSVLTARDINETLKGIGITPCLHSCATAVYCRTGTASAQILSLLQWKAGWIGATMYNGQDINQWKAAGFPVVTGPTSHEPPCTLADPDLLDETDTYCPWRSLDNSDESSILEESDAPNNATDITGLDNNITVTPAPSPDILLPVPVPAPTQALIHRKESDEAKCRSVSLQESGGSAKDCLSSRNDGGRKRGRKLRGV